MDLKTGRFHWLQDLRKVVISVVRSYDETTSSLLVNSINVSSHCTVAMPPGP